MAPTSSLPLLAAAALLTDRAGHAFTARAMLEGFACHARGVELSSSSATRVEARVRSKRAHDVELRAEEGALLIRCSCPARSLGLEVCKHAWAALLEVDRQGGLDTLRGARDRLRVRAAPIDARGEPRRRERASSRQRRTSPRARKTGGRAR